MSLWQFSNCEPLYFRPFWVISICSGLGSPPTPLPNPNPSSCRSFSASTLRVEQSLKFGETAEAARRICGHNEWFQNSEDLFHDIHKSASLISHLSSLIAHRISHLISRVVVMKGGQKAKILYLIINWTMCVWVCSLIFDLGQCYMCTDASHLTFQVWVM